jgi:CBS domain-containing protein
LPTRLREIMTPDPVTVDRETSLAEAARLMRDRGIGDVVVTSNGAIVGIVTDRDIVVRAIAADVDAVTTTVASVCSPEVRTLEADDSIVHAVELMREHDVRRIPIVDGGELVGIVALGDLAVEKDPDSVLGDISEAPPSK